MSPVRVALLALFALGLLAWSSVGGSPGLVRLGPEEASGVMGGALNDTHCENLAAEGPCSELGTCGGGGGLCWQCVPGPEVTINKCVPGSGSPPCLGGPNPQAVPCGTKMTGTCSPVYDPETGMWGWQCQGLEASGECDQVLHDCRLS